MTQPKAKSGTGKKPAAAPFGASKASKAKKNPLFEASPKNFGIGALTLLARSVDINDNVLFIVQVKTFNPRQT